MMQDRRYKVGPGVRWAGIATFVTLLVSVAWVVVGQAAFPDMYGTQSNYYRPKPPPPPPPPPEAVITGEIECESNGEVELQAKIQGTAGVISTPLELEGEEFEGENGTPLEECEEDLAELRELIKYSKDAYCKLSESDNGEPEFQFVCTGSKSGLVKFLAELIAEIIDADDD